MSRLWTEFREKIRGREFPMLSFHVISIIPSQFSLSSSTLALSFSITQLCSCWLASYPSCVCWIMERQVNGASYKGVTRDFSGIIQWKIHQWLKSNCKSRTQGVADQDTFKWMCNSRCAHSESPRLNRSQSAIGSAFYTIENLYILKEAPDKNESPLARGRVDDNVVEGL